MSSSLDTTQRLVSGEQTPISSVPQVCASRALWSCMWRKPCAISCVRGRTLASRLQSRAGDSDPCRQMNVGVSANGRRRGIDGPGRASGGLPSSKWLVLTVLSTDQSHLALLEPPSIELGWPRCHSICATLPTANLNLPSPSHPLELFVPLATCMIGSAPADLTDSAETKPGPSR